MRPLSFRYTSVLPDRRRHRGPHPEDSSQFGEQQHNALRSACNDFGWLLEREYAETSALKLVGDRYGLRQRQRLAVLRSSCTRPRAQDRGARQESVSGLLGADVWVDGFNVLITTEAALSGGVLLRGVDGAYRDMASVHGSYRGVQETQDALGMVVTLLRDARPQRVTWVFDRPVSNSGWLATQLQDLGKELGLDVLRIDVEEPFESQENEPLASEQTWRVALANNPDRVVAHAGGTVASSDSWVLDQCKRWTDLPGELIGRGSLKPWIVDFHSGELDVT